MDSATEAPEARLNATPAARWLVEQLKSMHGPVMFHLSGGCCEGGAPMCMPADKVRIGSRAERVGEIVGCEFWMDCEQLERWAHTAWTVDVVPGRVASPSLEAQYDVRFIIRARICSPLSAEGAALA